MDAGARFVPSAGSFRPVWVISAETAVSSFTADRKDNQAYTDAGALVALPVGFSPSGRFSTETAFSTFAALRKDNQAYTDAGALFVPQVPFAPFAGRLEFLPAPFLPTPNNGSLRRRVKDPMRDGAVDPRAVSQEAA